MGKQKKRGKTNILLRLTRTSLSLHEGGLRVVRKGWGVGSLSLPVECRGPLDIPGRTRSTVVGSGTLGHIGPL